MKDGVFKKGSYDTGVLISLCSSEGWLVVTNNHVVMCKDEAASARVYFDYDKGDQCTIGGK